MSTMPSFAINGRFLTQNTTGVQRYALNVVRALDAELARKNERGVIIAPRDARDPDLLATRLIRHGRLSGHAWEQISLPGEWGGRLLNLCNTAPALKSDQIVCIHDANVFAAPDSYNAAFRILYRTLQPLLARRSARIATVSHAAARQIARHLPIRSEEIAVLPNGHEHALHWDPSRARIAPEFLEKIAGTSGRPFVLAFGSQARHKNLGLLVEAAPGFDELGVDLVIAGGDSGIFATSALEGRRNVHLIGRVSDDDLALLLERALCLAFPSWTEGFGLPIVEAMARGCPVIASRCASMPEVCGDAALLASPSDPSAWVDHVRALMGSSGLRSDLVGRGRERVRLFSWSETADGYLDLLARPMEWPIRSAPSTPALPGVSVVVATRGRPETVALTIRHLLATQSLKPEAVIVSCVDPADAGDLVDHPSVTIVTGPPGLAAQRNTALARLPATSEIVVFFDDDFVADADWLAAAAQTFRDEAQVVGFTGHVVADGITGRGIGFEEAVSLLEAPPVADRAWVEPYSPYGCNMAFRVEAIGNIRFDERLVLYAWLEDRDFGARMGEHGGRLIKSAKALGVHMGIKSGRVSGVRLGYAQIVNPLYLLRKGSMTLAQAAGQMFRNVASNFGKALWPEPFIDRRGRMKGNLIAFIEIIRGRLEPERAAVLPAASTAPRQPEAKIR